MISFYAIKHWIYNLRSGNFIVRNSPLDIVGSLLRGSIASLKTSLKFTVGTGATFALCYELDEILILPACWRAGVRENNLTLYHV